MEPRGNGAAPFEPPRPADAVSRSDDAMRPDGGEVASFARSADSPSAVPTSCDSAAPASTSGSTPSADADGLERYKAHHSYIWLGSIRTVFMLVGVAMLASISSVIGILSEVMTHPSGAFALLLALGVAFVGICAAAVIVVVYQVISYRHFYFTIGPDEFSLYRGILSKKRVHIPYRRIQSVDQRASLLQRIAGVCTVSIDTAGGAANKAVTVPYLTKHQAEWLRVELFARKQAKLMDDAAGFSPAVSSFGSAAVSGVAVCPGHLQGASMPQGGFASASASGNVLDAGAEVWREFGGVFGGAAVDTGRVSYEYGLTNKELVLTGLSNSTSFALIVVGALGVVAQGVTMAFDLFPRASENMVEGVIAQAAGSLAGSLALTMVLLMLAVLVVVWLLSAAGTCIGYGGFKARRRGDRIEVEHGLLQHVFVGVDVARVQSVSIEQTFVRRLLGYCKITVGKISAGVEGDGSSQTSVATEGVVIHPFVKMGRVPEILAGIIPEYADVPRDVSPVAPVALRRALLRRCLWAGGGFYLTIAMIVMQAAIRFADAPSVALAMELDVRGAEMLLFFGGVVSLVLLALGVVVMALDAVGAVLWFRESSFGFNDRFMQVTNGGFSRSTVSFPRRKIQFGRVASNPFQRRAHTATVEATVAAGVGGTTYSLKDVREEEAAEWLDWVRPRGSMVQ